MNILIGSLGSLIFIGLLVFSFQRLKILYKAKQEPFLIVATFSILLVELAWVALVLTYLLQAIFGAFGAKMPFEFRLYSLEMACANGGWFLFALSGLYLFAARPLISASNHRRQRKELTRLGWQVRKPREKLAVGDFKHLVIIGISLWKFEDLRGIETMQRYFQHDDWTVQVFFLNGLDRLPDIRTFSPDVKAVWPTPIVSEYQDGVLVHLLSGKDALTWMKQA